jgi:hypothetical protein
MYRNRLDCSRHPPPAEERTPAGSELEGGSGSTGRHRTVNLLKVGDRSGNPAHPVKTAGGELALAHSPAQERRGPRIERRKLVEPVRRDRGVARQASTAGHRTCSRDTGCHNCGRLAGFGAEQFVRGELVDRDVQIEAIQERS